MTNFEDKGNIDSTTVDSFGAEWSRFDQSLLQEREVERVFQDYFCVFPWDELPSGAEGFDMGCGSGRWARCVAARVGRLNCVDPSDKALEVASRTLKEFDNVRLFHDSTSTCNLPEKSQDFGYSLGVLHHVPDTASALRDCVKLLKFRAPFLLYLYYRFDNRPFWFRAIWRCSEIVRRAISRLPEVIKSRVTDLIALTVYWPVARTCSLLERTGLTVDGLPLSYYRRLSFYVMRTDARDRFGTPLEQRFSREEIRGMMLSSGLTDIQFSSRPPFWVAVGRRAAGDNGPGQSA